MRDLESWNIGKLEYGNSLKKQLEIMNYKLNQKHPKLIRRCGLKAER